jgi:hypothetical protein
MPKFSTEPTPDQLLELATGAKYQALAEPLNADMNKLKLQVEQRVYKAISTGTLTPEMALQAWYEMHSYHRLIQKFNQRIKMGVSQGEALSPQIGEDNG